MSRYSFTRTIFAVVLLLSAISPAEAASRVPPCKGRLDAGPLAGNNLTEISAYVAPLELTLWRDSIKDKTGWAERGWGLGWRSSFDITVTKSGKTLQVIAPDGTKKTLAANGKGWRSEDVAGVLLGEQIGGGYKITWPDGSYYLFAGGVLTELWDASGRQQAVLRWNAGRLQEIVLLDNRRLTFTLQNGRYDAITDAFGWTTRFKYDSRGNLQKLVRADGSVHELGYDPSDRVVAVMPADGSSVQSFVYGADGFLSQMRNGTFVTTTFEYEKSALITSGKYKTKITVDSNCQVTAVTQDDVPMYKASYAAAGKPTAISDFYGTTVTFDYGAGGLPTAINGPQGSLGVVYNTLGFPLQMTLAKNGTPITTSLFAYEQDNRSPKSITTTAANGKGSEHITISYANGALNTLEGKTTGTATFRYDEHGDVIEIVSPEGQQTVSPAISAGGAKIDFSDNGIPSQEQAGGSGFAQPSTAIAAATEAIGPKIGQDTVAWSRGPARQSYTQEYVASASPLLTVFGWDSNPYPLAVNRAPMISGFSATAYTGTVYAADGMTIITGPGAATKSQLTGNKAAPAATPPLIVHGCTESGFASCNGSLCEKTVCKLPPSPTPTPCPLDCNGKEPPSWAAVAPDLCVADWDDHDYCATHLGPATAKNKNEKCDVTGDKKVDTKDLLGIQSYLGDPRNWCPPPDPCGKDCTGQMPPAWRLAQPQVCVADKTDRDFCEKHQGPVNRDNFPCDVDNNGAVTNSDISSMDAYLNYQRTYTCTGKTCGPNKCGWTCTCNSGLSCNNGQCVQNCTPNCSGRVCGSDNCNGSCGTCATGYSCSSSGQCVATCKAEGSPVGSGTCCTGLMLCDGVCSKTCQAACIPNGSSNEGECCAGLLRCNGRCQTSCPSCIPNGSNITGQCCGGTSRCSDGYCRSTCPTCVGSGGTVGSGGSACCSDLKLCRDAVCRTTCPCNPPCSIGQKCSLAGICVAS